jgi:hypothetical protein
MTGLSSVAPFAGSVADAIENIVASIPAPREAASSEPGSAARALARKSATRAAALSGRSRFRRGCSAC